MDITARRSMYHVQCSHLARSTAVTDFSIDYRAFPTESNLNTISRISTAIGRDDLERNLSRSNFVFGVSVAAATRQPVLWCVMY